MKKLSTYLFLILFSFSASSFADDISELQIEGISIGDSLLDHLSGEEIITEIESNKLSYNYLTDEFGEVYLEGNFEIYDLLSFFVKPDDKNYTIYDIRGGIYYDDGIENSRRITYDENGNKISEGYYENGKMEGKHTFYNEDGSIKGVYKYKDGFELVK